MYYKNLELETSGKVYEPSDDSFLMADNIEASGTDIVLDIGTGTGIQALLAAQAAREVIAIDINQDAIELARGNATANSITNIEFRLSSLFENVDGKFDLILFNPPYLPVDDEDKLGKAWSGGTNGMRIITPFLEEVGDHLRADGRFMFIVSSLNKPKELLNKYGLVAERKIAFENLYLLEGF